MSDEEKFAFGKASFVMGAVAGAVGTALFSIAVPDSSHQFVQEARERYLGLRHRHRRHHRPDGMAKADSHVEQLAASRGESADAPQR